MPVGSTVAEAITWAYHQLHCKGVPGARRDARLLVATTLGLSREETMRDGARRISREQSRHVCRVIARRAAREPVALILGEREFWSLPFAIGRATLIPRPETETLIEAVLALRPDRQMPLRIADFGTGSGCLLLALLREYHHAVGVGIDVQKAALDLAHDNAIALGVADRADFVVADWGDGLAARFDVIVANPPYIPTMAIEQLAPEVAQYESRAALDGGADGLVAYRRLAPAVYGMLRPTGVAVFEVGAGQADAVTRIFETHGLAAGHRKQDLAGIDRCVVFGHTSPGILS